jgi:hypothetical protein
MSKFFSIVKTLSPAAFPPGLFEGDVNVPLQRIFRVCKLEQEAREDDVMVRHFPSLLLTRAARDAEKKTRAVLLGGPFPNPLPEMKTAAPFLNDGISMFYPLGNMKLPRLSSDAAIRAAQLLAVANWQDLVIDHAFVYTLFHRAPPPHNGATAMAVLALPATHVLRLAGELHKDVRAWDNLITQVDALQAMAATAEACAKYTATAEALPKAADAKSVSHVRARATKALELLEPFGREIKVYNPSLYQEVEDHEERLRDLVKALSSGRYDETAPAPDKAAEPKTAEKAEVAKTRAAVAPKVVTAPANGGAAKKAESAPKESAEDSRLADASEMALGEFRHDPVPAVMGEYLVKLADVGLDMEETKLHADLPSMPFPERMTSLLRLLVELRALTLLHLEWWVEEEGHRRISAPTTLHRRHLSAALFHKVLASVSSNKPPAPFAFIEPYLFPLLPENEEVVEGGGDGDGAIQEVQLGDVGGFGDVGGGGNGEEPAEGVGLQVGGDADGEKDKNGSKDDKDPVPEPTKVITNAGRTTAAQTAAREYYEKHATYSTGDYLDNTITDVGGPLETSVGNVQLLLCDFPYEGTQRPSSRPVWDKIRALTVKLLKPGGVGLFFLNINDYSMACESFRNDTWLGNGKNKPEHQFFVSLIPFVTVRTESYNVKRSGLASATEFGMLFQKHWWPRYKGCKQKPFVGRHNSAVAGGFAGYQHLQELHVKQMGSILSNFERFKVQRSYPGGWNSQVVSVQAPRPHQRLRMSSNPTLSWRPSSEKSPDLMRECVLRWSMKGDVVCDFCCATASSGVAAVTLDRFYVGMDIDDSGIRGDAVTRLVNVISNFLQSGAKPDHLGDLVHSVVPQRAISHESILMCQAAFAQGKTSMIATNVPQEILSKRPSLNALLATYHYKKLDSLVAVPKEGNAGKGLFWAGKGPLKVGEVILQYFGQIIDPRSRVVYNDKNVPTLSMPTDSFVLHPPTFDRLEKTLLLSGRKRETKLAAIMEEPSSLAWAAVCADTRCLARLINKAAMEDEYSYYEEPNVTFEVTSQLLDEDLRVEPQDWITVRVLKKICKGDELTCDSYGPTYGFGFVEPAQAIKPRSARMPPKSRAAPGPKARKQKAEWGHGAAKQPKGNGTKRRRAEGSKTKANKASKSKKGAKRLKCRGTYDSDVNMGDPSASSSPAPSSPAYSEDDEDAERTASDAAEEDEEGEGKGDEEEMGLTASVAEKTTPGGAEKEESEDGGGSGSGRSPKKGGAGRARRSRKQT